MAGMQRMNQEDEIVFVGLEAELQCEARGGCGVPFPSDPCDLMVEC